MRVVTHPFSAAIRKGMEWSTRGTIEEPNMRCIRGTATNVRICDATVSGVTVVPNARCNLPRISRSAAVLGWVSAFLYIPVV